MDQSIPKVKELGYGSRRCSIEIQKTNDSKPESLVIWECRGKRVPFEAPPCEGFLGTWPEPPFYYLFFDRHPGAELSDWLTQVCLTLQRTYELDYEQWQQVLEGCKEAGPFTIVPGPGAVPRGGDPGRIMLRLDPGLVFGSGLHGSTHGCLVALGELFEKEAVRSAVDMGTGTGILAVACALLGAQRVLAVDKNPLAVQAALRNAHANGVADRIHPVVADRLTTLKRTSDLLLMNLEYPILLGLLKGNEWVDYPWVVVSGFLNHHWGSIETVVGNRYAVVFKIDVEGWISVLLSR